MHSVAQSTTRLTAFLAAVTMAVVTMAAPSAAASGFGDVDDSAFFDEPVAWMVSEGITNGVEPGCFGPHETVSRGQIATFLFRLDRALGNDPRPATTPFIDVFAAYQREPVGWLHAAGISSGTSRTTFEPDSAVTRGDFAVLIWRYAGQPSSSVRHPFSDVGRDYQVAAISWMAEQGITTGTSPTTFSPDADMTRAEAATFIWRFAAPEETVTDTSEGRCVRPLRATLIANGLNAVEAACAAPFLVGFDLDYLLAVVNDQAEIDFELLVAVVEMIDSGCLTDVRIAQLTRLFL